MTGAIYARKSTDVADEAKSVIRQIVPNRWALVGLAIAMLLPGCAATSRPVVAPPAHADEEPAAKDVVSIIIVDRTAAFYGPLWRPLEIPTDKLAAQFKDFVEKIGRVFQSVQTAAGDYSLEEIELHADVNAEGHVSLIAGATAGATAGIKVTFKRQPKTGGAENSR